MTINEILLWRQQQFQGLLKEKQLGAILFLMPARDGFDLYFTGASAKAYPPYDTALQSMDTCVLLACGQKPTVIHASYLTGPGEPDPLLTHFGVDNGDVGDYVWSVNHKAELYIDALSMNPRLGLVNPNDLREELYQFIKKYVPEVEFVDVTMDANLLKAEKCPGDLEEEKLSVRAVDRLFAKMSSTLRPMALESDVINHIRIDASGIGQVGNYVSDWVIIDMKAAPDGGPSVKEPLPFPGRTLDFGDRIQINVLAALNNSYSAGCGRCFVMGKPCEETIKAWDLAVKAQDAATSAIRPGVTIAQVVQKAVEEVYKPFGLDYKPSNWIFGLGLNLPMGEAPMAVPVLEEIPLKEGMFLCVAPKVEIPGKDPFCCMDTFVVTKDGCERLTKTPREIKTLFEV